MGWSIGNEVFDPVARKARELELSDEQVTELLTVLIHGLQERDWDTEDESLDEFKDDEAIVEAFRRNDITITCNEHFEVGASTVWCERERGGQFHADGQHETDDGFKWPVAAS